jgi:ATP-binding cassette, subfamily C, bacteriocin exporter
MNKKLQKTHVQQQGQSDCGVACLKMVLHHFNCNASFERLRELSGTTMTGTTMLGLLQAGQELGLNTEGFEADLDHLRACKDVCILHVVLENQMHHYVVYYGYDSAQNTYIIGDPSQPFTQHLTGEQLEKIWVSKNLLLIKPTDKLVPLSTQQKKQHIWFWGFVKEDVNLLVIAAVLGIAMAVLSLSTALFSQKLIDKILPEHDALKLYSGIGALLLLLLARSGMGYIRQLFLMRQSRDFNIRLIDYFYSSLLNLPKSFFDNRKTGELVARMNDTQRIQSTLARLVGDAVIDVLMIVVAAVAIFSYNVWIGVLSILWLPVFAFVVWRFSDSIVLGQREVMASYAMNESNFINTMQGTETIKVNNLQSIFTNATKTYYGLFQKRIFDLGNIGLRFSISTEIVGTIFIVAIILGSAVLVLRGALTAGSIMAIIQMVAILMASAGRLAMTNIQLQEAKVAFERMTEFTAIEPEFVPETDKEKAVITDFEELKVENLHFRFAGRKQLLKDVSFSVRKGEMIALIGESGGGKSTILQILQKFLQPESGNVLINGLAIDAISTEHWRNQIGVLPQQVHLFNGTLIENIVLGDPSVSQEKLVTFFEKHGFNPYFEQFPNGYSTILGENGVNISGGQMQLVGLARALWRNPQVLLLDEPTAGLDNDTERFVIQLLKKISPQMAIIILTHRISFARPCNEIYILKNGEISEYGDHNILIASDNLYKRAWFSQVA